MHILGVAGGLGSVEPTTAVLVNGDTLVDAGGGVNRLPLEEAARIRRVFLTHAHIDHVSGLPLLVEALFESGSPALEIHGLPRVLDSLRRHLFNWEIWPDFGSIPTPAEPSIRWVPVVEGGTHRFGPLEVRPFPAYHEVPACGYLFRDDSGPSFAFTGDSGDVLGLVTALNHLGRIDVLMTECSFPDRLEDLARRFHHLTPSLLAKLARGLEVPPGEIWVSHFKPSYRDEIARELAGGPFRVLESGYRRLLGGAAGG